MDEELEQLARRPVQGIVEVKQLVDDIRVHQCAAEKEVIRVWQYLYIEFFIISTSFVLNWFGVMLRVML